ncbi:unnamed protein product [Caenorhabditis auriculariae]|uniref:Secreted protein n=1 Tax=Caenorhabditis auriculariae TaxID=2777116 RepID=A0A8S1HPV0_9PELO|nr:unnamed protein product [Caenorhabditis auriculariae]
MRRLVLAFATCAAVADCIGSMLVQGRADTIRALRTIVRHSATVSPTAEFPENAWESSSVPIPREPLRDLPETRRSQKIRFLKRDRPRRHISNAVIESGHCEHVDLMDCSDFETDEMTCMMTATGMTCCVCTGALRAAKRDLF